MTELSGPVQHLIAQFGEQRVVAFFLVLARVSPLFGIAPLFSSKMIPARVRGIVAVALSIGISPIVAHGQTLPLDVMGIAALLGKELLVGFAFAYALAATFAALSVAGSFLDTVIGFSYGGLVDPLNGNNNAVMSTAYGMIGLMIFIAIDGDAWVIGGLARTYHTVGLSQYPSLSWMVRGAVGAFGQVMASALEVAGPVLLALILTDAAFGVVSRVVPNLNAFQVALPAKVVVALILIGATLPFVSGWMSNQLQSDIGAALGTLRLG